MIQLVLRWDLQGRMIQLGTIQRLKIRYWHSTCGQLVHDEIWLVAFQRGVEFLCLYSFNVDNNFNMFEKLKPMRQCFWNLQNCFVFCTLSCNQFFDRRRRVFSIVSNKSEFLVYVTALTCLMKQYKLKMCLERGNVFSFCRLRRFG